MGRGDRGVPAPPTVSPARAPTGGGRHTRRRNSAALPAFSDKRSVYSRRADSCPSATFIYKMLVKLLTVGAVEAKLRGKLTFLDRVGAPRPGSVPHRLWNSTVGSSAHLRMTSA